MTITEPPDHRVSTWLLVRGLPRDPHASPHLIAMLVSTVVTILLVRAFLAAAGYPQIGGGGLHIAHVLWGGLLMVVGLVLLLSFAGPVIRPLAAVVSGVGIGLFIDEIGKFVTDDNDYFYRPAAAVMYVIVVSLVLIVHLVHGRRPHHPAEHLAAAVDQTVAGVAGGFTPRRRAEVYAQLRRARDAPGAAEARTLARAVPDDRVELFDPLRLIPVRRVAYRMHRRLHSRRTARLLPTIVAVVLIGQAFYTTVRFGLHLSAHVSGSATGPGVPPGLVPVSLGLASTLVCTTLVVLGWARLRRDVTAAYRWFHRALLVNVLFTRVFEFNVAQFVAAVSVVVDVVMLIVVTAALENRRPIATAPGLASPRAATDVPPPGV